MEQAKQRVANEKKKQNEKKQKAENDNIRTTTSISYRDNIMKHFPDCYSYDELNRILSVALQTRECKHDNTSMKCSGKTAHWARRWYGASGSGGNSPYLRSLRIYGKRVKSLPSGSELRKQIVNYAFFMLFQKLKTC